jgi:hypothetical protein
MGAGRLVGSESTFYNLISLSTFSTLSINNLNALATPICNKTNFTNLYVSGASTVLSSLNVLGNTTLNNATTINSSLNVVGDINTSGLSVFGINSSLSTKQNNLTFNYPLLNSSNIISLKYDNTCRSSLNVSGITILSNNVVIGGSAANNILQVGNAGRLKLVVVQLIIP